MTEKLKYKIGDKVLVEAEVIDVDKEDTNLPYRVSFGEKDVAWLSGQSFNQIIIQPKISQAVMDWYEEHENKWADWDIRDWLSATQEYDFVDEWISANNVINLDRQHALATLIAYGPESVEVEKEKRYKVKLKPTGQWLREEFGSFDFGRQVSKTFTKQELIEAGFEGVFDNPMFEVEEVEE